MGKIKIEVKDGKAYLYTPYNQDFVSAIKKLAEQNGTVKEDAGKFQKKQLTLLGRLCPFGEDDMSGIRSRLRRVGKELGISGVC